MIRLLKYQKMQIKGAFRCFFKGLLTMAVLFVLLSSVLFTSAYINEGNRQSALIDIAVVSEADDPMMKYLVAFANGMSSVKSFCRLSSMQYDSAMNKLAGGDVNIVVEIPEDFYIKASTMQEAYMKVYISGEPSVAEKKLFALFGAVEKMMVTTEGAIYTMYDTVSIYDVGMSVAQLEEALFGDIINQFMNRDKIFSLETVTPYGAYSFIQFYIVTIIQFITLIFGICFLGMYKPENIQLERMITNNPGLRMCISFERIIAIMIPLGLMMSILTFIFDRICMGTGYYELCVEPSAYLSAWGYALCVAALIHLLASACSRGGHVRVLIGLIILLLLTLAGTIVPTAFLPGILRRIVYIWPAYHWQNMLLNGLWKYGGHENMWITSIITCVICIICSMPVYNRRLNAND